MAQVNTDFHCILDRITGFALTQRFGKRYFGLRFKGFHKPFDTSTDSAQVNSGQVSLFNLFARPKSLRDITSKLNQDYATIITYLKLSSLGRWGKKVKGKK